MTPHSHFQWHAKARLFATRQKVARVPSGKTGFVQINSTPPLAALQKLGAALLDGRPFCVSDTPAAKALTAADAMFVTQSGGSSGAPKRIMRRQASWIASFEVNATTFHFTCADRAAVLGGLSHSLALYGVLEALHIGADAQVLSGLTSARQHAALARAKTTVLYATPTQLRMLCAQSTHLPNLRLILCGGGVLDVATRHQVRTLCPNAALHVFYGAAETSFITLTDQDTPEGSVGRAYPGVKLHILDANHQPTTGAGTVWVASPYLCENDADGSDLPQQDGYISAGEIGQVDAQGHLWLMGRHDRMITIGDVNVYPERVEALIAGFAQIDACAVLPRPDPARGHHLVAVLAGPSDTAQALRIRDRCRTELGPVMTPKQVLWHPYFPMLPSGKPDLVALRHWVEEQP